MIANPAAEPPAVAAGETILSSAPRGPKTLGKTCSVPRHHGFALVGLAGIFLGLRKQLHGAIDEQERRGLIRSALINGLATIGFLVGVLLLARFDNGWLLPVLITLAFMAVIFYQSGVVQPRVLQRRHALEMQRDPIAAAKRRGRERVMCWIGGVVGTLGAMGGLIGGLIASGRL